MNTRRREPRFMEIAPGELRRVCLVCDTPLGTQHALLCDEHSNHKDKQCQRCGKATRGRICSDCRSKLKAATPPNPSNMKNGKRVLVEEDRPIVERMWEEGFTTNEIAEYLGLATTNAAGSFSYKRTQRGWKLPYRAPWSIEIGRKLAARGQAALAKRKVAS